ncbi:hypothetical protein Nepgr_019227 [Nepenthes gracilis]|uniref:Uncharacterized protein n=1 Tax=Nepenthes gracilis TaxID=150966 RepID=A0AAD3XV38_NEPGR|nr:hypothetical protein Nepgr_019227 [Nepenthes gracilis]
MVKSLFLWTKSEGLKSSVLVQVPNVLFGTPQTLHFQPLFRIFSMSYPLWVCHFGVGKWHEQVGSVSFMINLLMARRKRAPLPCFLKNDFLMETLLFEML